jgi:hypothetical protein
MKKLFLILIPLSLMAFAPQTDMRVSPGTDRDHQRADAWLARHEALISAKARDHGIPPRHLMAIVFPELVRYNAVYDFMETAALSLLYVQSGTRYADFSIGQFQMKPSFAEMVEADALNILDDQTRKRLSFSALRVMDDEASRRARINRLETVEGQVDYLVAFYLICTHRTRAMQFTSEAEKLRYLAACYNSGYRRTEAEIRKAMQQKAFHTGRLTGGDMYNYSDFSLAWYLKK